MSSSPSVRRQGFQCETELIELINKTGAAMTIGHACALNMDFADAAYDDLDGTVTDARRVAVAVTTENRNRMMAIARGNVAANARGDFVWNSGDCVVRVTTDANKGEFLTGTNASTGLTPLTLTEILALTTQVGIVGIALETRVGAGNIRARFHGEAWMHMCGGDN